jgi:NADPH:quinone reductase-like Zn-dependent oxidoreductase
MKALTYTRYGPPGVVSVRDMICADPAPGEVRVQVVASAVNTADWRMRAAAFPGVLVVPGRLMFGILKPRNTRLGTEFSGKVEACGEGVSRFKLGDRVYGISPGGGASAEFVNVSETGAIQVAPPMLDLACAAALPFGGLCALSFLRDFAGLSRGQRLLIVGASGGVGVYAIQVGKALGAHVTAVAGPDNQGFTADLGADAVIDYRATKPDAWPRSFDTILDTIGALSPSQARRLLRPGGVFLPLNFGLSELFAALQTPFQSTRVRLRVNEDTAEGLERLNALIETGQLRPVIGQELPLSKAVEAHRIVEARHKRGAVLLRVSDFAD